MVSAISLASSADGLLDQSNHAIQKTFARIGCDANLDPVGKNRVPPSRHFGRLRFPNDGRGFARDS